MNIVIALTVIAFVAGYVDAIAGGGGLLTIPALLIAGLSPVEAVATNKLQGTAGVAASSYAFWAAAKLDLKMVRPAMLCAAAGAALGSLSSLNIDPVLLNQIVPALLILISGYFAFGSNRDEISSGPRLGPVAVGGVIAAPIGFYDGLLGPAAGTLYLAGLAFFTRRGLLEATAQAKVLNLVSNGVSLLIFLVSSKVVFAVGVPMALCNIFGARLGAAAAVRHGTAFLRPVIAVVSLALAVRLFTTATPL